MVDGGSSGSGRRGSTLVGLIGAGIQQSRTPAMHEAEAKRQGLNLVYKKLDVERMGEEPPDLTEILRYVRYFGFAGLNVTFPYKQAIMPLLDEISDVSQAIGAVNTVVIRGDRLAGFNTDYWGFRESFQSQMKGELRECVLQLGAGGAGAAVAQALLDSGVGHLMIHDVDADKAAELAEALARRFPDRKVEVSRDAEAATAHAKGVVNTTPVGMAKLPGTPIPVEWLDPAQWVIDIIYFPMETEFLKAAEAKGCRVLNGSGMAVWQAVRAFQHFTGRDADPKAMTRTFRSFGG